MARRFLGIRWWLGLAFALVAAVTAIAVVAVLSSRSERAFRAYAQEFAVGNSVAASESMKRDRSPSALQRDIDSLAARRHLALFAFDADGRRLTASSSFGSPLSTVPFHEQALQTALARDRFIKGNANGSALVVGLPIHGGLAAALVAYSLRPELADQLGIVHNQFLGAAAGLVIATLIALRLARIARAAQSIGEGDFSVHSTDRFPDEVGSLGRSIERMRLQLEAYFETLQNDRDRLERLLDRLDEGVLLVDRSLRVEFANGQAQGLLGAGAPLVGRQIDDLPLGAMLREVTDGLFSLRLPSQLRVESEDDRTLLVSGIPPSATGENAIIVITDESQRERAERAQREFATNAAHELRTPLASIVGAVEMLQTGAKEELEARDRFLALIEREAGRLTRLTRALLVLARAEARQEVPRLDSVMLRPILDTVVRAQPPSDGIAVVVDCARDLAVAGDEELIEQALSSVTANAMQHTTSGSVTLRGRVNGGGRAVVEVIDTGRGIQPRDQPRIFDRFYRGDRGSAGDGFGLGLSIARGAVRALGGEIEVDSEPGRGTTIRILLPVAEASGPQ